MPTTGGSDFYPFGVKINIICWFYAPYFIGDVVTSKPFELKTLNCISEVRIEIERMTFKVASYNFYLSYTLSKGVFFTKASFQYGLRSNLPGSSIKLTLFLHSLSMAALKHGWFESGWLSWLVCVEVTFSNDLTVLLVKVEEGPKSSLLFLAPFANFLSRGLDCCCS